MKSDPLKKIEESLYLPDSEAALILSARENERRKRLLHCISQRMENPLIPDKMLVDQLVSGLSGIFSPVNTSTAYRDISAVTKITGNIQLSAKNWYRYMIIEGAKEAFDIAKSKQDGKAMASALNVIGKYTMADRPDNDMNWDEMIPIDIEPSADADLLENIEQIDNIDERRKELRELFGVNKSNLNSIATDAEFE